MKLLLGNPGGGFANAWWCTGPPCPYDTRDPFNASHNTPLLTAESVLLFLLAIDEQRLSFFSNALFGNETTVTSHLSLYLICLVFSWFGSERLTEWPAQLQPEQRPG